MEAAHRTTGKQRQGHLRRQELPGTHAAFILPVARVLVRNSRNSFLWVAVAMVVRGDGGLALETREPEITPGLDLRA